MCSKIAKSSKFIWRVHSDINISQGNVVKHLRLGEDVQSLICQKFTTDYASERTLEVSQYLM